MHEKDGWDLKFSMYPMLSEELAWPPTGVIRQEDSRSLSARPLGRQIQDSDSLLPLSRPIKAVSEVTPFSCA